MALQNLKTYFEGANISDIDKLLNNKCIVTEKLTDPLFMLKERVVTLYILNPALRMQ